MFLTSYVVGFISKIMVSVDVVLYISENDNGICSWRVSGEQTRVEVRVEWTREYIAGPATE